MPRSTACLAFARRSSSSHAKWFGTSGGIIQEIHSAHHDSIVECYESVKAAWIRIALRKSAVGILGSQDKIEALQTSLSPFRLIRLRNGSSEISHLRMDIAVVVGGIIIGPRCYDLGPLLGTQHGRHIVVFRPTTILTLKEQNVLDDRSDLLRWIRWLVFLHFDKARLVAKVTPMTDTTAEREFMSIASRGESCTASDCVSAKN